jgi:aspartyl-tRNA(Asn)/glutamyl-tRNA(Gln) amidotransferase subunit A
MTLLDAAATEIAAAVRSGTARAADLTEAALARIAARDPALGAFTDITAGRARAAAARVDRMVAQGHDPGPLAGVPYAVKNLFDLKGLPARAGSKINRDAAPATRDATLVARLDAAGAVCLGGLNMGEYAYDFTGENAHDGPSRNPHDPSRMAGGFSGGSGTAVAAGMVALALGSDTNGSIRVPSAFCGLFGLKPTYGGLSRAGTFPFVASLDHLGPLARSAADLAAAYDAMRGPDKGDPACRRDLPPALGPELGKGIAGLRVAVLGGYFAERAEPGALAAVARVGDALGAGRAEFALAGAARAAAYLVTMAEGAALHLDRLRQRAADFDPEVRDRPIAGAMLPGAWVAQAQKVRRAARDAALALFQDHDILLAPSTPCAAPLSGHKMLRLGDQEVLLRPNTGIFTQPISCIGLPVVAVPVWPDTGLPYGVQVIAAPHREDLALRVAHHLETAGIARARVAQELP